jgi:signal transduction histidine kinase
MAAFMGEAAGQLQAEIQNLRSLISELRPAALDDLGLEAALGALAERTQQQGLEVRLSVDLMYEHKQGSGRLAREIETATYRIVQEALTNVVRHAPGATACVGVTYEPSHVSVEVTNTAAVRVPFQAQASAAPARGPAAGPVTPSAGGTTAAPPARPGQVGPGYGLAGIAERVASCGGSLALGPAGDGGFTVTARLPLA